VKKKRLLIRQGDVLLVQVDELPEGLTKVKRHGGRIVLAEGETTGHAHAIADRGADLYELVTPGDVAEMRERFLRVEAEAGVELAHDEHTTLSVPPGNYRAVRQREYAPDEIRQVAD